MADTSELGWRVVNKYTTNPIASDSEDEKRIQKAEARAIRKAKSDKGKKPRRNWPYRLPEGSTVHEASVQTGFTQVLLGTEDVSLKATLKRKFDEAGEYDDDQDNVITRTAGHFGRSVRRRVGQAVAKRRQREGRGMRAAVDPDPAQEQMAQMA
ncbi:hypothetical protein DPMN_180681 [Dreissena polymorpha]|uniref:Uncharacterized protein n=1 Tax=Dreissena polymorpha TaxID=45954 RepID=A0A9D4EEL5_DREPO|nr:hypothetical protein DPMN_180681 [Dreissena polymorpha]